MLRNRISSLLVATALATILLPNCNDITSEIPPVPNHVTMRDNTYEPETLNVNAGDTVTWVNKSRFYHTITSGFDGVPDGLWHSGVVAPRDSFAREFTAYGSFPYYDAADLRQGMHGWVTVAGGPNRDFKTRLIGVFVVQWLAVADSGLIHLRVSAPTTGWVSIGFNSAALMQGANFLIGYVLDDSAHIQDNFGSSGWIHVPDTSLGGTDNITNRAGTEVSGSTELQFTIPLDSGDPYDFPLVIGQAYSLLLAYGPNGADDFTSMHEAFVVDTLRI
jgi:plastocyanin